MPANQLPYFPLHVADYLNDPAVVAMDADTEGCYIRLLCRSWASPTPGVIPAGIVEELCGMHRVIEQYRLLLSEDFPGAENIEAQIILDAHHARRRSVLEQLRAAFDTEGPDHWIQKRMVVEHRRITNRHRSFKDGARKTNEIRGIERLAHASRTPTARQPGVEVDVEVDSDSPASRSPTPVPSQTPSGGNLTLSGRAKIRSPFARPTLDEVTAYCAKRQALSKPRIDPEHFLDYYESNGWRVGKNPMKDWRAAVRTWEANGFTGNGAPRKGYNAKGGLTAEAINAFAADLREKENRHEQG